MNEEVLFEQIVEILEVEFEIEKSRIKVSSSFYYDLRLDSLDLVDFSLALEKVTNKVIPVERLKEVSKIKDVISMMKGI
jgi:acyl carrier protein